MNVIFIAKSAMLVLIDNCPVVVLIPYWLLLLSLHHDWLSGHNYTASDLLKGNLGNLTIFRRFFGLVAWEGSDNYGRGGNTSKLLHKIKQ